MIPSTRESTSCNAPFAICGSPAINAFNIVKMISVAESTIIGRLSTMAEPIDVTIVVIMSKSTGRCSINTSMTLGRISPMTSAILERSPSASFIPLVNSPRRLTPSVARSVRTGKSIVPSAFLAAVAPTERYCNWSSSAP